MNIILHTHSFYQYQVIMALNFFQNDNNGNDLPTGLHQKA